jgi:methionine-rich copper-binding protein CopC
MTADVPENLALAFGSQMQTAFVDMKIQHVENAEMRDDQEQIKRSFHKNCFAGLSRQLPEAKHIPQENA